MEVVARDLETLLGIQLKLFVLSFQDALSSTPEVLVMVL